MLKLVAGLVAGATLLTVGTVSAFASSQGNCFGDCQKTRVCDTTNCSAQCYVDEILNSDTIVDCLNEGGFLSVSVVELSGNQGEEITQYVSGCTSDHHNVSCSTISSQEAHEAHHVGLSYGKYEIYAQIAAYDPDFTPEEANEMTMRELRDLLDSLQAEHPDVTSPPADETGSGCGNGSGHGHGNHK